MHLNANARIIFYSLPVNMYKGFDSLLSIVINELKIELATNTYVLFVNAERNRLKMLFFEKNHISIFAMRLAGVMQIQFGKNLELSSESFYHLITHIKSRRIKSRYGLIRDGF